MRAARREAHDRVAALDAPAVDQPVALHLADAEPGHVEIVVGHHARVLRRLPAEQCGAGLPAAVGDALDQRRHYLRIEAADGHVVEEEERARAGAEHVVDAHRDAVDAGRVQGACAAMQHELRADAVRPRHEQPVAELEQAGEAAVGVDDAGPARRAHGRREPADDRLGRVERDARGRVGVLRHATGAGRASNRKRPPSRSSSGISVG